MQAARYSATTVETPVPICSSQTYDPTRIYTHTYPYFPVRKQITARRQALAPPRADRLRLMGNRAVSHCGRWFQ